LSRALVSQEHRPRAAAANDLANAFFAAGVPLHRRDSNGGRSGFFILSDCGSPERW